VPQRRALICGIGGQDGAYLAKFLINMGYDLVGTSRDAVNVRRSGLRQLGIDAQARMVSMAPHDFRSVLLTVTRVAPDEINSLAGQTSVGLSFDQPVETIESIAIGMLNLMQAISFVERPIAFYNAGSSECFGDTGDHRATEETSFRPRSPYAVHKTSAQNLVVNYREAYRMHACTGILFIHESPLRPERFVTLKTARAAARIAAGSSKPYAWATSTCTVTGAGARVRRSYVANASGPTAQGLRHCHRPDGVTAVLRRASIRKVRA
jgi:GDPmannose 4,6-dehydratase